MILRRVKYIQLPNTFGSKFGKFGAEKDLN